MASEENAMIPEIEISTREGVSGLKTIVFVCTGNTCRSPMAAGIFRVMLSRHGIGGIEVTSCGTGTFPGLPVSDHAVSAAAAYGADIAGHRSRPISQYLLDQGDLFVCMTEQQRNLLADFVPAEKLRVLAGGVRDPYGGTAEQYGACAAQIHAGLEALLKEVQENEN